QDAQDPEDPHPRGLQDQRRRQLHAVIEVERCVVKVIYGRLGRAEAVVRLSPTRPALRSLTPGPGAEILVGWLNRGEWGLVAASCPLRSKSPDVRIRAIRTPSHGSSPTCSTSSAPARIGSNTSELLENLQTSIES